MKTLPSFTPFQAELEKLADQVLQSGRPICIDFPKTASHSPNEIAQAARAFQQNFATMRRRTRERQMHFAREAPGFDANNFKGAFDDLGVYKEETENEWTVTVRPNSSFFDIAVVRDAETSELLPQFTPEGKRWAELDQRLLEQTQQYNAIKQLDPYVKHPPPRMTEEEIAFFFSYDEKGARGEWEYRGWKLPEGYDSGTD